MSRQPRTCPRTASRSLPRAILPHGDTNAPHTHQATVPHVSWTFPQLSVGRFTRCCLPASPAHHQHPPACHHLLSSGVDVHEQRSNAREDGCHHAKSCCPPAFTLPPCHAVHPAPPSCHLDPLPSPPLLDRVSPQLPCGTSS